MVLSMVSGSFSSALVLRFFLMVFSVGVAALLAGFLSSDAVNVSVGFVDEVFNQVVGSTGADFLLKLLFDKPGSKFHGGFTSHISLMSSDSSWLVGG